LDVLAKALGRLIGAFYSDRNGFAAALQDFGGYDYSFFDLDT
jgi:hypothetical protein